MCTFLDSMDETCIISPAKAKSQIWLMKETCDYSPRITVQLIYALYIHMYWAGSTILTFEI